MYINIISLSYNKYLTFHDKVHFLYIIIPFPTSIYYILKPTTEEAEVVTAEISIEGSGLKGDVNGDGEVGIGDIVSITNIMSIRP